MIGKIEHCPTCGEQPKIFINKERGADAFHILCENCYEVTPEWVGLMIRGDSITDIVNEWNDHVL